MDYPLCQWVITYSMLGKLPSGKRLHSELEHHHLEVRQKSTVSMSYGYSHRYTTVIETLEITIVIVHYHFQWVNPL